MYEGHVCVFVVGNLGQEVILAMLGESYDEAVVLEGLESVGSNIRMTSLGSSLSGEKALGSRRLSPVGSKGEEPARHRSGRSSLPLLFDIHIFIAGSACRSSSRRLTLGPTSPTITLSNKVFLELRNFTDSNGRITIYKYDYGTCFINEAKRIGFKITNRSEGRSFRFDWGSHPSVTFSPSVGYLNERETKDIVATFFASEPTTDTQVTRQSHNFQSPRDHQLRNLPIHLLNCRLIRSFRERVVPIPARSVTSTACT